MIGGLCIDAVVRVPDCANVSALFAACIVSVEGQLVMVVEKTRLDAGFS